MRVGVCAVRTVCLHCVRYANDKIVWGINERMYVEAETNARNQNCIWGSLGKPLDRWNIIYVLFMREEGTVCCQRG